MLKEAVKKMRNVIRQVKPYMRRSGGGSSRWEQNLNQVEAMIGSIEDEE